LLRLLAVDCTRYKSLALEQYKDKQVNVDCTRYKSLALEQYKDKQVNRSRHFIFKFKENT